MKDGEFDQIGCGIGADLAVLDVGDLADACEQADRAATAAPTPVPARPAAIVLKLARVQARSVRARVTTDRAAKVKLVVRHKGKVLARATVKTKAGKTITALLRFNKRLPRRASVSVTATAPDLTTTTLRAKGPR